MGGATVASDIVKPKRDSSRPVERVGGLTAEAISGLFGNPADDAAGAASSLWPMGSTCQAIGCI